MLLAVVLLRVSYPSPLHPHNELLSQTQTVTSSETTYGGRGALMHCESTLFTSALSIVLSERLEHIDVVQLG